MKPDPKLMTLALGFAMMVACQSVFLGQLAGDSGAQPVEDRENCRTAEQPPWIDDELEPDPCPIKGQRRPA